MTTPRLKILHNLDKYSQDMSNWLDLCPQYVGNRIFWDNPTQVYDNSYCLVSPTK